MSRQIQLRRGTDTQNDNFTGAEGEIIFDISNQTLRVHDGATPGGVKLAKASEIPSNETMAVSSFPGLISKSFELGASGSQYTAPADGYFSFIMTSGTTNGYLTIYTRNPFLRTSCFPSNENHWAACFLPVTKGNNVIIEYNLTGKLQNLKFYYANGVKN